MRIVPKVEAECEDAATTDDADPQEGVSRASVADRIEELTLSNGIRVALYHDATLPSVNLSATWACGLLSETEASNGVNGLIASLLTQGAGPLNSQEFSQRKEDLGISIAASSGNNSSSICLRTLNDAWDESLELLGYVFESPHFDADALERERATKLAQWEQMQLDPISMAFAEVRERLFIGTPYHLNALGSETSLKALTREDLQAHFETQFLQGVPYVAVSGDFDRKTIVEDLERLFKNFSYEGLQARAVQPTPESGSYELSLPKEQAVLVQAYESFGVGAEQVFVLELLQEYLGDMAGPLFGKIREELGLVYYVNVSQFQGLGTGLFAFYLGTSEEQLPLAKEALTGEIQTLCDTLVADDVLDQIKAGWLSNFALGAQSNEAIANSCALAMALGRDVRETYQKADKIQAVTAEDIREVCRELFARDAVAVTVLPES